MNSKIRTTALTKGTNLRVSPETMPVIRIFLTIKSQFLQPKFQKCYSKGKCFSSWPHNYQMLEKVKVSCLQGGGGEVLERFTRHFYE